MAYKVGMLDTDSAYQRAFMEYLNLRATIPIRLLTFTSEEALEQFCDQNTLDLLLVGDEMSNLKWKKQTVVLTKSREFEKKEHYIFHYQSMEMIVKYILDQMDQQHPNVENEYAFLAVYSPLGRCGKIEYAKKNMWEIPAKPVCKLGRNLFGKDGGRNRKLDDLLHEEQK